MATYIWSVQPVRGTMIDPAAMDWTVLQHNDRMSGLRSQAYATRWAIDRAEEAAEALPPGSELVVELIDEPHGVKPSVDLWRKTVTTPASKIRSRPLPKGW